MCAVSKESHRLEAMIIATKTADDDDDTSDLDSDDDSINTTEELDGDIGREVDEYLFSRASSNESVTTLDTRMAKTLRKSVLEVHEIAQSPTKKQKAAHAIASESDNEYMDTDHTSPNQSDTDMDENDTSIVDKSAVMDSGPLQQRLFSPGSLEDLGEGL